MLGSMDAPNQVPEPPNDAPIVSPHPYPSLPALPPAGLLTWLIVVAMGGVAGLLFKQPELALFTALAGLFAVAHAADLDAAHLLLYRLVAWSVPALGLVLFGGMGMAMVMPEAWGPDAFTLEVPEAVRVGALVIAWFGAALAVATAFPPVAHHVARWWFRTEDTSHVLRLATRVSILGMLMYFPAAVMFMGMMDGLMSDQPIIGRGSLWGSLIGLSLLAVGGVGYRLRRGGLETLERLGLKAMAASHWIVVGLGVAALVALNAGTEWVQNTWFPALAQHDHQVTEMITRGLNTGDILLLGVSAGVGEELAIRGALQPRLGIARAAALFALLHVQYSWFGVLVIFALGMILGAIRLRTSTTVAILVHTLYDIVAVFTARP